MNYTNLGRTGLKVSRLCLGCMSFGVPQRGGHPWTLDDEQSRPFIDQRQERDEQNEEEREHQEEHPAPDEHADEARELEPGRGGSELVKGRGQVVDRVIGPVALPGQARRGLGPRRGRLQASARAGAAPGRRSGRP